MSGAEQVGRHGEVAHQQRSLSGATAPAFPLQGRHGGTEQQIAQALLAPVRLGRQGGDHRTVNPAGSPCRLARPEQGGHIGEAQQPAPAGDRVVRLCAGLQQPRRAPAAADAGQLGQIANQQIGEALRISPGQMPPAPQGLRMGLHLEAPALQHRHPRLQTLQAVVGQG